MEKPKRKVSLRTKLNILIIGIILTVAAGLIWITYSAYCEKVEEDCKDRLTHAVEAGLRTFSVEELDYFWSYISSDEYQALREEAVQTGNAQMLINWMKTKPSYLSGVLAEGLSVVTLYEDYQSFMQALDTVQGSFRMKAVYLQKDVNGVTYNLADPDESILYVGSIEAPIDVFVGYEDNVDIPPLIYHSQFGWLCTAVGRIGGEGEDAPAFTVGGDLDMTGVLAQQHAFLMTNALAVLILLLCAIILSWHILNRIVVRRLKLLANAAGSFANEERALTSEDVVSLDIRSRDEIGDLYEDIKSMEERIVSNTDRLVQAASLQERTSTELRTAAMIQSGALPDSSLPEFSDRQEFALCSSMTPAKEVGGDFYDHFFVDDTHLALVIADVSDKGVPAALFMMFSKILISERALAGKTPAEILTDVNERVFLENKADMFVTVWMGILDLETGVMACCNAGHEYPFVRSAGGGFTLMKDTHGIAVGVMRGVQYKGYELQMHPGDAVFVYTDGATDANNEDGEFFGSQRLLETLNGTRSADPAQIIENIGNELNSFMGDAEQFDDVTMLCIEYRGKAK